MNRRFPISAVLLASLVAGPARSAVGPRNEKGWRGIDTLAPAPTLPTGGPNSYLNLLVGTSSSGVLAATPGDDETFSTSGTLCGNGTFDPYGGNARFCDLLVHTNGIITRGTNAPYFDNRPLLDARFSRMYMAPFHDDLAPVAGVSTITWELEVGSHYIVRWNDFTLYSNPSASLTFQVAFNIDSTNPAERWVVFQYIKMQGTGANGSSATIGLQYNASGGNFARHGPAFNEYAYNVPGSIVLGDATGMPGTALQAILFHIDADNDQLPGHLEARLLTSDSNPDSDTGGVDDGVEFVASTDPTFIGDDVATDTDMDGLTNLDEAFYGSSPLVTDTDGDGLDDPAEVAAGSDPADPASIPPVLLTVGGNNKRFPQATVDAGGNIHAIAFEGSGGSRLVYYMFSSVGTPLIAETPLKGGPGTRRAQIHAHAGKIYVTYQVVDGTAGTSSLNLKRINPAVDDQDGDAADPLEITEVDVVMALGDRPHHHDAFVSSSGVHLVWEDQADDRPANSGDQGPASIRYGRVNLSGAALAETTLMDITAGPGDRPPYGVHRRSFSPQLAVDSSGVAHVVFHAQSRPRSPQSADYAAFPNGQFYAATDGATTSGPYYLGSGRIERSDVALFQDRLLYIARSSGQGDGDGYYLTTGVQLGILNTESFGLTPRVGDFFGVEWAIEPDTMALPFSTIHSGVGTQGAAVQVLPDGAALVYFSENRQNAFCVAAASPQGGPIDQRRCFFAGQHHYQDRQPNFLLPSPTAAFVGVVHGRRGSDLRYDPIPLSNWDTSGVLPLNMPPIITTAAPAAPTSVGTLYSYAAAAMDEETASGNLVWSLLGAPSGMNVSVVGLVTFTPALTDVGVHTAALQVCDDGSPARCSDQTVTVTVPQTNAPVITSAPAVGAVANAPYQYQVTATDADGDIASFSLPTPAPPPGDMALTPNAGGALLTWTPAAADLGTLSVGIRVTDSLGLFDSQTFSILVTPGASGSDGGSTTDQPPAFTSVPGTTAIVDETYSYQAVAVDPDDPGATVTYELTSAGVDDMALSEGGLLTWTPAARGTFVVTILGTSGSLSATQSFSVTVVGVGSIDEGCGCEVGRTPGSGAGLLASLLAIAALWLRRRRG